MVWNPAMTRATLAVLLIPLLSGCANALLIKPIHSDGPFEEQIVQEARGWTLQKIALVDVNGLIVNERKPGFLSDGSNPVSEFREKLETAAGDPYVRAVVVRINSPGGAVTASDIMHRDLLAFRQTTGKPVVACLMDVAASGGYYVATACDWIVAHPTTTTGSIGVIMSLYNLEGLCSKLGITSEPIKSGVNKDLGNPARKMTEEERTILQNIVNQYHDQFIAVVCAGRKLPEEYVRRLADGRVYTAAEAKQYGLVDEIGYLDDAIARAKELAGIRDAYVVAYDREGGYRGSIYAGPRFPSRVDVRVHVPGLDGVFGTETSAAVFWYLWRPGQ
jgi:protease-4